MVCVGYLAEISATGGGSKVGKARHLNHSDMSNILGRFALITRWFSLLGLNRNILYSKLSDYKYDQNWYQRLWPHRT